MIKHYSVAEVGDTVDFGCDGSGSERIVLPVVRLTKTMIVCSDGQRTERVMRSTGFRRGAPYTPVIVYSA